MSNTILFTKSIIDLCEALKNNTIITEIDFSSSDIPQDSFKIIFEMLEYNKTIKNINFNDTINISEEYKKKIINKLEQNVRIKKYFRIFIF